mmetsp:Transcript_39005/g.121524  ORF Transcript_39005/g.121524 Transcript_39005/m.121524 type:complete len:641 (+) Transcript_39005:67-1989(+)
MGVLAAADGTTCVPCMLLPLEAQQCTAGTRLEEGRATAPPQPQVSAKASLGAGLSSVLLPSAAAKEDGPGAVPPFPRASPAEAGMAEKPLNDLDRHLKKAVSRGDVPGLAYAILKDGKLVRASAFGVADVESRTPWRFDTLCRIYSMTKGVAVCGLMRLVEDGRVSLADPVSRFLPAFAQQRLQVVPDDSVVHAEPDHPAPRSEITIKHLLTHCSGLSQGASLGDEPSCGTEEAYEPLIKRVDSGEIGSLEHWCDELAKLPLRFQPGERWEYSYSIDLLGRIIEVVSGKKLDEFLRQEILAPLGMHDTTFALPEAKRERLASFYRRGEDNSLQCADAIAESLWVEPRQQSVLSAGGTVGSVSGGLVSTLNDYARLCCMLQNGGELNGVRVLREDTVQMMFGNLLPEMTGQEDSWCLETAGLGFGLLGSVAVPHVDANWYDVPGEIGWGGLAGTAWAVDRRDGLVVLSFCQVMYELWIDEEVRKAARKALGYSEPKSPGSPQLAPKSPASEASTEAKSSSSSSEAKSPASEAKSPSSSLEMDEAARETSMEASTPSPKGTGAAKRALEQPDAPGDETPKRQRFAHEAILSQGSSEKLRLEKEGEAVDGKSPGSGEDILKESNPFSLPLPDLAVPAKVVASA